MKRETYKYDLYPVVEQWISDIDDIETLQALHIEYIGDVNDNLKTSDLKLILTSYFKDLDLYFLEQIVNEYIY